jgi:hypothetical protein
MASTYVFNNGGSKQFFNFDSGRSGDIYHGQYMYTNTTPGKMDVFDALHGNWETVDVKSYGDGTYVSTDATMTYHTIVPLWSFNCNEYGPSYCSHGGSRYNVRQATPFGTIDGSGNFIQQGTIPAGGYVEFASGQGYTGGLSWAHMRMNGYWTTGGMFVETFNCYVKDANYKQHPNNYYINTL